jgi:hypothetical protein
MKIKESSKTSFLPDPVNPKRQGEYTTKPKKAFNFIIQQSQIIPGTIKPRHLVATSDPIVGSTFYSDGTNFKINPILSLNTTLDKIYIGIEGDTNLYRSAADMLATDDDMKFITATKGIILKDRDTGTFYRLKVASGTLGVEAV